MKWTLPIVGLFAAIMPSAIPQTSLHRSIDRCAQDGLYFYPNADDPSTPVQVERDGVTIRITHPNPKSLDATIAYTAKGHTLVQSQKDFEAALAWLTISENGSFAATYKVNASDASTQLFRLTPTGDIVEDTDLVPHAERIFTADAKRFCHMPGTNTTAIKWIDKTHLLLAIDAWGSGTCYSNFTEGFIIDFSSKTIQRKLTEQQLINLPAVCTWNLVPVPKQRRD